MKKKYYTIFFASDWNQYSRSFQISKKGISFLLLFGILLIIFAVVGLLRITNLEPLTREWKSLQKDQKLLKNIINDLNLSMDLDSSALLAPQSDSIQSILLQSNQAPTNDTNDVDLYWTPYWGWPFPTYRLMEKIGDGSWKKIHETTNTNYRYTKSLS